MPAKKITAYLGLGSNLGNREDNLKKALRLLGQEMPIKRVSSPYITSPVGYTTQPDFINAVCEVTTSLTPEELFILIKKIEITMGRTPNFPNGPRIIDVDILLYDNCVIDTPQLIIPHPRMMQRAFVLVPFAEIAPDIIHPVSHETIRELLSHLGYIEGVQRFNDDKSLIK